MKRRTETIVKIAVLALILAGVAVLIRGASDKFRWPAYDAGAPTAEKFARLSRWIPRDSEFYIAADIPRLFEDERLRSKLSEWSSGAGGVASELADGLVFRSDAVGMLMLVGNLGRGAGDPHVAVLAQGTFDRDEIISKVRTILAEGHAGLVSENIGGRALFAEGDVRDPFGFIILDGNHIAVGERDSLVALFREGVPSRRPAKAPDALVFGRASLGPRLQALFPRGISVPSSIDFASDEALTINARIPCGGEKKAQDLSMFLEGIRSLLLLQEEHNVALTRLLGAIVIEGKDSLAGITFDVRGLFGLGPEAQAGGGAARGLELVPQRRREAK